MSVDELPSGRALRVWAYTATVRNALFVLAWVVVYLMAVVPFDAARLAHFGLLVGAVLTVILVAAVWLVAWLMGPVSRYLDASDEERTDPVLLHDAFRNVMDLPRLIFILVCCYWIFGGIAVAIAGMVTPAAFTPFEAAAVLTASLCGGGVSQILSYVWFKDGLSSVRAHLVAEVTHPDEREALIRPMPIRLKLFVSVIGLVAAALAYSISVAQVRSMAHGDEEWIAFVEGVLDRAGGRGATAADVELALAEGSVLWPDGFLSFEVVPAAEVDIEGLAARLPAGRHELAEILASPESGAFAVPSRDQRFAWRRLDGDDALVVGFAPRSASALTLGGMLADYGLLALFALGGAVGFVHLSTRDLTRAAEVLGQAASRVATGDLAAPFVFESEDEFGTLSRSFATMRGSLRGTVGHIAAIVDGVEDVSRQVSEAAKTVAEASRQQVLELTEAESAMATVLHQTRDIHGDVEGLAHSVEGSSAAIAQIGATSRALTATAEQFSEHVVGVAAAITEMTASIRSVGELADGLSVSAAETTASMEEMASSAMQIDANATETARLTEEMVGDSEQGRAAVHRTQAGMDAIRGSTESVNRAIDALVDRSEEIGRILGVIESVADETALLALNASIIAAQAGDDGHGFKVVADQVKQLARRTLASTHEIAEVIDAVQRESHDAVAAIAESSQSVGEGVTLASAAAASLEQITASASTSGQRVGDIVEVIRGHAKSSGDVARLMERVNEGAARILGAGEEQQRTSSSVLQSSSTMGDMAEVVKDGAGEQARSLAEISGAVGKTREVAASISGSVERQTEECAAAAGTLTRVRAHSEANARSVDEMRQAVAGLLRRAKALREDVSRFRL